VLAHLVCTGVIHIFDDEQLFRRALSDEQGEGDNNINGMSVKLLKQELSQRCLPIHGFLSWPR